MPPDILSNLYMLIVLVLLFTSTVFHNGSKAGRTLEKYADEINYAAKVVHISPRLLASIVYAEHKLNYTLSDEVLDGVLAHIGYNSSVGVAQVKVNTAGWIEKQLLNRNSDFYLGDDISILIKKSTNREDLIGKLLKPDLNLLYAACYIAMIEKLWVGKFDVFSSSQNQVGIIASLYCLGLKKSDGELRLPHEGAKMNEFGKTAQEFYDSLLFRKRFND